MCVCAVYTGYPSKCRVCIGNCIVRFMPIYSVRCRPGVHWLSIHMASPVVWIGQLSGTSLDLSHSDLVRYRCYKRKSVGAHSLHAQISALLMRRAYTWYMVCVCVCVYVCACVCVHHWVCMCVCVCLSVSVHVRFAVPLNGCPCPDQESHVFGGGRNPPRKAATLPKGKEEY